MSVPEKKSQTTTFWKYLKKYFQDYGGVPELARSPLFLSALAISAISYRSWKMAWSDLAISVIPNLLGFSLGTYALLFSLISPRIRLALRTLRNSKNVRYLDEMNATFFHFIIVQVVTFVWAFLYRQSLFYDMGEVIAKKMPTEVNMLPIMSMAGGAIGTALLLYSVLLVIGSSLTVWRIARIVDPDPS